MTSETRRFQFSLLASVLINILGVALAGWLLRPPPEPALVADHARIKLMTLALPHAPTPQPIAPPAPVTQPRPAAPRPRTVQRTRPHVLPKPHKLKPPRPQKRRRPGARVHSSQPAPPTRPAGGSDSGAPANQPALAAATPAAPPIHVLTGNRPSRLLVRRTDTTASRSPSTSPTATLGTGHEPPLRPSVATQAAAVESGHGAGGSDAGKGAGAGAGTGTGSGNGTGASRDAGEPFGVGKGMAGDGGPRHVVYVLDISGSMTSRISRADDELERALEGLGPGETFDIIAFSDRVQTFDPDMTTATPDTTRRAERFLGALKVDGGTDLEAALSRALTMPDVNEVVLLTDGVPTVGETDFKKLARRIRELNRNRARILAVGMVGKNPDGTDDSFEAAQLLSQIARESGGQSKIVPLGVASP